MWLKQEVVEFGSRLFLLAVVTKVSKETKTMPEDYSSSQQMQNVCVCVCVCEIMRLGLPCLPIVFSAAFPLFISPSLSSPLSHLWPFVSACLHIVLEKKKKKKKRKRVVSRCFCRVMKKKKEPVWSMLFLTSASTGQNILNFNFLAHFFSSVMNQPVQLWWLLCSWLRKWLHVQRSHDARVLHLRALLPPCGCGVSLHRVPLLFGNHLSELEPYWY